MSGHSKWANIKNRKGAQDKKRSEAFTKMAKNILTAIRSGGGTNLESNYLLKTAIEKAREVNMPKENIDRLIARFEERKANLVNFMMEGYGPGGVPIVVEVETDNKNRTLGEIKLIFKINGGNVGEEGSVMFQFERMAEVELDKEIDESIMLDVIDAGAEDVDGNLVLLRPAHVESFKSKAKEMGFIIQKNEFILRPLTTIKVEDALAEQIDEMISSLEDNEDVINVFSAVEYV